METCFKLAHLALLEVVDQVILNTAVNLFELFFFVAKMRLLLAILWTIGNFVLIHGRESLIDFNKRQEFCLSQNHVRNVRPSQTLLVLSPGSQNLPLSLFTGIEQVPQEKNHSYPITFTGDLPGNVCTQVIELPEMFTDVEMVENILWLQKRCFDKVLVHLSKDENWSGDKMEAFKSFLKLFLTTYGDYIKNYMQIVILDGSEVTPNVRRDIANSLEALLEKVTTFPTL